MCNKCYRDISYDVPTTSRHDLNPNESVEDDEEWEQMELFDGLDDAD